MSRLIKASLAALSLLLAFCACRPANPQPIPTSATSPIVPLPRPATNLASRLYLPLVTKTVRPNFVLIVTDDQRYDTLDAMPNVKARLFEAGLTFSRAYVTTPLCCPSRSSILTGLYAHQHHAIDNYTLPDQPTFVETLHRAGYFTGIVGKYLNPWEGQPRPEFDYWVANAGHGSAQRYFDPRFNVNGDWRDEEGYITFALRDYALDFLDSVHRQGKPFLFVFTPNAPHFPANPAPGDENLYPDLPPYRPPSFMEKDISDKPMWLQRQSPPDVSAVDALRRRQLQSLHALDEAVGQILDKLDEYGLDKNTVVMFISDNGVFWGEHQMENKDYAYEEAVRVPFAVWYPTLIQQPRADARLVANIDIAPTILDLAGLRLPADMDGRSLLPLLKQTPVEWRDWLLLEGWVGEHPYQAIRTQRYLYVETQGDVSELYDSERDPYQMENQAASSAYTDTVKELQGILKQFDRTAQSPENKALSDQMRAIGKED